MTELGCAQEYKAIIHWLGGARPFTAPGAIALTSVTWNRTVNDTAEATIVINKGVAGESCCADLGRIEPWVHELSIYRNGELVWQGLIIRVTENATRFLVEAWDVTAWLAHCVNTTLLRYLSTNPADPRHVGPVQEIAETIIRANLEGGLYAPSPDWPRMLPYIVRDDDTTVTRFEKDGSDNNSVWQVPILTIMNDELVPRGLEYATVGRALLLGRAQTTSDKAKARLNLDSFAGDVEIVRDGTVGTTLVWVTNQNDQEISGAQFGVSGVVSGVYGRLDLLVRSTAEGLSAYDLWQIARASYNGRNPMPTSLKIPDGAGLSSRAPVTIHQLVPGVRIDVAADGMCMGLTQPYRLSDLDVEWRDSAEKVGVSLVPIGDPYTGAPPA
ncbi:hypothetical protein ACFV5J_26590 [Streptomyces zaomyceticus]|uniref:hypothetical protein n=1 Tax=Streptomyces zaomyceticus TaxID=68286 RepID=UPI0036517897